jgi:hypothetical protein
MCEKQPLIYHKPVDQAATPALQSCDALAHDFANKGLHRGVPGTNWFACGFLVLLGQNHYLLIPQELGYAN